MKISVAKQAGFCFGVKRALELAQKTSNLAGEKSYTLGPLIHNPQVVAMLDRQGISSIDSLDEIDKGELIIRSHGVVPEIFAEAEKKGLKIRDATCPFVKKAQQLAKKYAGEAYQVIIVGDSVHPEVKGIFGWAGNRTIIVENLEDAHLLSKFEKVCVIAQTTYSPEQFLEIVKTIESKADEIKVCNTICSATKLRQEAAQELAYDSEIMIVVGGKNSSNTKKLAQICTASKTKTYHVEDAKELESDWFEGITKAGVTAGASTPDWILEEVIKKMTEFKQEEEKLEEATPEEEVKLEEATPEEEAKQEEAVPEEIDQEEITTQQVQAFNRGDIITGTVVQINEKEVLVDIGGKAEGIIPLSELSLNETDTPEAEVNTGDNIDLYVIKAENEEGVPILSKRRADRVKAWEKIEQALQSGEVLTGKVEQVVKGGLLVDVGLRGFMPASLIEIGYVESLEDYLNKELQFKVVEIDREKNKIILSQKEVLEKEVEKNKEETFKTLAEGQTVPGIVRRITNFGAFVDIGGVDGLLHVSELSWGRVNNPKDVLTEGDKIDVYVIGIDKEKGKISLGLKQLLPNPWEDAAEKYQQGQVVDGKVVRIVAFGVFVELEPGVEGLVHISQLAREHVNKPEEIVSAGQEVKVKVLEVDTDKERISLSIKEATDDVKTKEVAAFMEKNDDSSGVTIGDLFGDLGDMFKEKKNDN